ncbi:MAG: DUF4388 domain-containing protein, partial [Planctomycetota bacterium]
GCEPGAKSMALGGDLQNVNLADLFQTLSMNRQEGTLLVRNGIKEKRFHFSDAGVSLVSGRTIPGFSLGRYLVGKRKLTQEDLQACLERQRRTGEILGQILVDLGHCEKADIEEVVRYHAAEELYEIFTWDQGEFEFLEGTGESSFNRPSPYAGECFDAAWVVMEAARRIDEWDLIRGAVPSNDDIFIRTGKAGLELSEETWGLGLAGVYEFVDGTQTVGEILEGNYLSPFDTAKTLLELIRNELIRPCTFAELTSSAWDLVEKRNLKKATEVLSRAHSLEPRDVKVLDLLAECYEKIDEKRPAGEALIKLGRIHFEDGRTNDAMRAIKKAEKFDPGSADVQALLMKLHLEQGEAGVAADKACEAAQLFCEKQDFERSMELCREALASAPDHIGLRIALANSYLGTGQRELALEELEEIAGSLEATRSFRKLPEIYKKILQLDSSRREYVRRLQEIQSRKSGGIKRIHKIVAGVGIGAALLVLALILFTGGTSLSREET